LYEMALTDFVNDKKATYGYVANNKNIASFKKYMARFIGDYSFKYKDTFPNLVLYKIGNVDYDQNKIGSGIEKIYYTLNTKQGTNRLDALFDEVFINAGKKVQKNVFDQNRLGLAVKYNFNKTVATEISYIYNIQQKSNGDDMYNRQILRFTLYTNFNILKKEKQN
ncbi:MAG: DUF2490 domain-containing protein, partial [Chitinophagales bacterium]|nr:DUF2490 domain-containing protein [Chitinophagales bacterium]